MKDMRVALPALWIFMVLNYLYCDVASLLNPATVRAAFDGKAAGGAMTITPEFLLVAGMLMEIPMAMTLISRLARHGVNRWANVVAAAFMTLVQLGSLTVGSIEPHYAFFSAIEIGTLVLIAVLALRWTDADRFDMAAPATSRA